MMTVHRLHAGDGYRYLTRQVATADHTRTAGEKLVDYYTADGTPPGRWHGQGAVVLGVSGVVSEAQMKALFGEGMHPDADRIVADHIAADDTAADAVAAARLGQRYSSFAAADAPLAAELKAVATAFTAEHGHGPNPVQRVALRKDAAAAVLTRATGTPPTEEQVIAALAAEKRGARHPVAGFDLVFTPQKSVSLLWGLGDDDVRRAVEKVHHQAVTDTLDWVQTEAGKTRRGRNGVRQIDTHGLTIACFDHYDNRNGDPNLHTHATVANKVLGVDGRWSALDARVLYSVGVAASARYNHLIVDGIRRELGAQFYARSTGAGKEPILEVQGVTEDMVVSFSRSTEVLAREQEITVDYRAAHGHEPGRKAEYQLHQQAILDTRKAKAAPRSLASARTDWATHAAGYTGGRDPARWVNQLLDTHRATPATGGVFEVGATAAQVVTTVARRRATWTEANLRTAAEAVLSQHSFPTPEDTRAAVEQVVAAARDAGSVRLSIEADGPAPHALARADAASVYTVHGAARFTSEAVLDAERALVDAAHTPTTCFVTGTGVTAAIDAVEAESGRTLNDGQRQIAAHLACSGQVVAVAVGPAGTGKTTAMATLVRAWTDDHRQVIALAPSAAAARVLGEDLGVGAQTVARLLTVERLRDTEGAESTIAAGAMLLVDEAGMTATADLKALVDLAQERGAVLRMVGDPHQLAAVESGGALRLLAADTGAPELSDVVRFTDPAEAQAGLAVRGGDAATAWAFYTDRGRVAAGGVEELREQVLAAHSSDTAVGRSSLMLAATTADVTALNAAAHHGLVETGAIDPDSAGVALRDGLTAQVGDTVVTRRNDPGVRVLGGHREGAPVTNGDLWRVRDVHPDGSLTLSGTTHRGTLLAPGDYVAAHVELGYAATVHRAQGMTVDTAHLLMDPTLTRSAAYVGLTRGREANHLYLVTDEVQTPGVETEAHHHHGGLDAEQAPDPAALFAGVVARTDDNLTATETLTAELDHTDDTTRLRQIHTELVHGLATARGAYLLSRALPAVHEAAVVASGHYRDLLDTLAAAHAADLDTGVLVTAITTTRVDGPPVGPNADPSADADAVPDSLTGARDPAAVLRARADTWIAAHTTHVASVQAGQQHGGFRAVRDLPTPTGLAPAPPRHSGADTDLADHTTALAERITRLEAAAAAAASSGDATRTQVQAGMDAHPVRTIRGDRLDLDLRELREQANQGARVLAAGAPAAASAVAADHTRLRAQVTAITTARTAQAAATAASPAARAATAAYFTARGVHEGASVLRRRSTEKRLAEAAEAARDARYHETGTRTVATGAVNAAARSGAQEDQWDRIEARAADTTGLAAEVAAAAAADTAATAHRDEVSASLPRTQRRLRNAELERARRGGLTPERARIEAQLRGETPPAGAAAVDVGDAEQDLWPVITDPGQEQDDSLGV